MIENRAPSEVVDLIGPVDCARGATGRPSGHAIGQPAADWR